MGRARLELWLLLIRTAIRVAIAVPDLGLVHTLVVFVQNAVGVVVRIETAILVLEAVDIFWLIGAHVVHVRDRVVIAIGHRDGGAAVTTGRTRVIRAGIDHV